MLYGAYRLVGMLGLEVAAAAFDFPIAESCGFGEFVAFFAKTADFFALCFVAGCFVVRADVLRFVFLCFRAWFLCGHAYDIAQ